MRLHGPAAPRLPRHACPSRSLESCTDPWLKSVTDFVFVVDATDVFHFPAAAAYLNTCLLYREYSVVHTNVMHSNSSEILPFLLPIRSRSESSSNQPAIVFGDVHTRGFAASVQCGSCSRRVQPRLGASHLSVHFRGVQRRCVYSVVLVVISHAVHM